MDPLSHETTASLCLSLSIFLVLRGGHLLGQDIFAEVRAVVTDDVAWGVVLANIDVPALFGAVDLGTAHGLGALPYHLSKVARLTREPRVGVFVLRDLIVPGIDRGRKVLVTHRQVFTVLLNEGELASHS